MARRSYRRSRRSYSGGRRRSYRSRSRLNVSPAYVAGVAAGFSNYDKMVPAEIIIGAAVAPVRGIGTIKAVAQGALMGNLLQAVMKNKGLSGTSAGGLL